MLIGAMHGPAEAAVSANALTLNALTLNALTSNGPRHDAATPGVTALQDLNGVAVEGVVLPSDARR
jgi:hypothetical protein